MYIAHYAVISGLPFVHSFILIIPALIKAIYHLKCQEEKNYFGGIKYTEFKIEGYF